ncbi:MAG: oxygen-independent coproporphyrinogen III oxidase [Parvicellaceae bacterium]
MIKDLIRKYNVPGPRYTSYPTVPYWDKTGISYENWLLSCKKSFNQSNNDEGISLYIHLPFCENLCTFCGCHKRITKRHDVEEPYIETVLKEWQLYVDVFGTKPKIKELHLGGGTPTFFSAENLKKLINGIKELSEVLPNPEFSFEGHPNHTSKEQLQTLFDLGFTRNSFGVQDYDYQVQKTINRVQPFENVKKVSDWSKEIGYKSISHDLVYGLPKQNLTSIKNTILKTQELLPDRIAFYSYAHVPWIKGVGQRGFDENDLPKDAQKRELYEMGKALFSELGYVEIGMDHFALKHDSLYKAVENKTIHRNFMGYSSQKTQLMVGLGMSSISDSWYGFAQNVKTVEEYQKIVGQGRIPIFRGHLLTEEDLVLRKHILNLMCHFKTSWTKKDQQTPMLFKGLAKMKELEKDGLIKIEDKQLTVTEKGKVFIRNICMCLDARMLRNKPTTAIFSQTI